MSIDLSEDNRYDRQRLITWWDQERLHGARVLVVGAGAIGNEVIKNLALLGVGQIHIIDLDLIESSNLARCVLFREEDEGRPKAVVAAEAAQSMNPDVQVLAHVGNVMTLPLGQLREFDLVIGALDNREARLWVNQSARKLGLPWVDGAIEGLAGVARVFGPDGPCYDCTLGEADYALLAHRKSCALLSAEEMAGGRTPTTLTTASVIAGVQVQEAVKLLHGQVDQAPLVGRGFIFQGDTMDSYVVSYSEDHDCASHDRYEDFREHTLHPSTTVSDVASEAGDRSVVEFEDEIVVTTTCLQCDTACAVMARLVQLPRGSGACGNCGEPLQLDVRQSSQRGDELWSARLGEIGYGALDVVTVRVGVKRAHFVLVVQ